MIEILRRRVERPFASAHWILLVALIVAWQFALWGQACNRAPYYLETVLATLTVCAALWSRHLREAPVANLFGTLRVVWGGVYDLALLVVISLVVALPIALVMPAYQCYGDRQKVMELIMSLSPLKLEIARRIELNQSVRNAGQGLEVAVEGRVKGGVVLKDGVIVSGGDDPPVVVIFQPSISAGTVGWRCMGFPERYLPAACRHSAAQSE